MTDMLVDAVYVYACVCQCTTYVDKCILYAYVYVCTLLFSLLLFPRTQCLYLKHWIFATAVYVRMLPHFMAFSVGIKTLHDNSNYHSSWAASSTGQVLGREQWIGYTTLPIDPKQVNNVISAGMHMGNRWKRTVKELNEWWQLEKLGLQDPILHGRWQRGTESMKKNWKWMAGDLRDVQTPIVVLFTNITSTSLPPLERYDKEWLGN